MARLPLADYKGLPLRDIASEGSLRTIFAGKGQPQLGYRSLTARDCPYVVSVLSIPTIAISPLLGGARGGHWCQVKG